MSERSGGGLRKRAKLTRSFRSAQWVNYFVHAGHLHIKGFKMSKSLKNFITIQGALKQNTARQIRMCFLIHKYNDPMDYGDDTMSHAVIVEKSFSEFFLNAKAKLRSGKITNAQKWGAAEAILALSLEKCKMEVNAGLCDDFDTPRCMKAMQDLVGAANKYMQENETFVDLILRSCAVYVTDMFKIFGLIKSGVELGFPIEGGEGGASKEEVSRAAIFLTEKLLLKTLNS